MIKSIALLILLLVLNTRVHAQNVRSKHLEVRSVSIDGKLSNELLTENTLTFTWTGTTKDQLLTHFVGTAPMFYGKLTLIEAKERKQTSESFGGFTFLFNWDKTSEVTKKSNTTKIQISIVDMPQGDQFVLTVYGEKVFKYAGEVIE